MHRTICSLGPLHLYSYGLMLALAFALGTWLAVRRSRSRGVPSAAVYDLVLWILVGSIAGARLFFVIVNSGYYLRHPLDVLKLWEGGLVLYGGIIFGFGAGIWFLKRHRLPVWRVADIIAPSLALGIAIGRIGCFLNGCCYGVISYRAGMRFPSTGLPPVYEEQLQRGLIAPGSPVSLPVLPTQLYEAAACLAIAGLLVLVERKAKLPAGVLFWLFIALYSVERFFMEGLRYYEQNFRIGPLTIGQLMSMLLFIIAVSAIVIMRRRARGTIA